MKITAIIASLIAAFTVSLASAQTDDLAYVGFIDFATGSTMIGSHAELGSAREAEIFIAVSDDDMIADSFGTVTDSAMMSRSELRALDADAGRTFEGIGDDGLPFMIATFTQGADVYILLAVGDDIDADEFEDYTERVAEDGLDADGPDGWMRFDEDDF